MNVDRVRQWANILPEYDQGQGHLRVTTKHGDKFCCLGVACELYHKETGEGCWEEPNALANVFFSVHGQSSGGSLPPDVAKWFGLGRDGEALFPYHFNKHTIFDLAVANDTGYTFDEIKAELLAMADRMEKKRD